MKGLYISNLDTEKSPGYRSKIIGQIIGFNQLDVEMGLIETSACQIKYTYFKQCKIIHTHIEKYSIKNLLISRIKLLAHAYKKISKFQYNFLYLRYPRADPFLLIFLLVVKIRFKHLKILHEIPTFPYDQEYLRNTRLSSKLIYLVDFCCRFLLFFFVDRIISIRYSDNIFNIPTISIGNGIQENQFPISQPIQILFNQNPHEIHFLGVANLSFCHGYDRVVKGIFEYQQTPSLNYKVYFHVVSPENAEVKSLKKLCQNLSLEDNIIFHGSLEGEKLNKLFDQCHIAVGSLAAHRKNLKEASALKLREYALRGKLFLNSIVDSDFLNFDYCYVPENSDNPININDVITFIIDKLNVHNLNQIIRDYATTNLSWSKQLKPVVEFLRNPEQ